MRAGPIRDRVELQAPTTTQDVGGAAVVSYATEATRYGQILPLSGHERMLAGQMQSRVVARLSMRYYDGLDETYRVVSDGVTYGITAVINPDGNKREHLLDLVLAT